MGKTYGNQILPYYARAQAEWPLYAGVPLIVDDDMDGPADAEAKLDVPAKTTHVWIRKGFPPDIIGPYLFKEWLDDVCAHELGHPYEKLAILYYMAKNNWTWPQAEVYVRKLYWEFRGFAGTWEQKQAEADAMTNQQQGWDNQPRESWAEAFKAAFLGRYPIAPGQGPYPGPGIEGHEKTFNGGKPKTAAQCREFFLGLTKEVTVLPFQDLTVANGNYWAGRGVPIDTIIIHSMAGTWQSANIRFNNPTQVVSAHRAICYDGIQRRWVEDEYTAYHCGVWPTNIRSLSIEVEDKGDSWGVRPDIVYSMAGALVAEWVRKYPAIKLDRYHVVPGMACHRDVYNTACPAGLDVDRILNIAKNIIGGGQPVPFDPVNNAADKKWLDDRYGTNQTDDAIKKLLNPIAAWVFSAPNSAAASPEVKAAMAFLMGEQDITTTEKRANLEPHNNMKGEPPAGHEAAQSPKAGTHTPGKEKK